MSAPTIDIGQVIAMMSAQPLDQRMRSLFGFIKTMRSLHEWEAVAVLEAELEECFNIVGRLRARIIQLEERRPPSGR